MSQPSDSSPALPDEQISADGTRVGPSPATQSGQMRSGPGGADSSTTGLDVMRPFLRPQALAAGITDTDLRAVAYRPVLRSVYVRASIPDSLVVRCRAALLLTPGDGILSHETAARLWCPTGPSSSFIHVSFGRDAQVGHPEIKVHRYRYRLEVHSRHGMRVTSPGMTFVHLAVKLGLLDLVAFGDQLVRRGLMEAEELTAYTCAWEHHGRRMARLAARLVRAGAESVPETHLRVLLVLAGLPEPVTQHPAPGPEDPRYRLDLAYPEVRLAIEYDGRWHDDPEQRDRDEARRRLLEGLGWTFLIVRADDLYGDPESVITRVRAELCRLGARPPRVSHAWRQAFAPVAIA